jgi:hypothetical protein
MRRLLIVIAAAAAIVAGVWYGVGATLPEAVSVRRTRRIEASPEQVYAWVGHLDRWPEWTAWMQVWTHPDGAGRLEITSAEESRGIGYELTFAGSALAVDGIISLTPAGQATDVLWIVDAPLSSRRERWFGLTLPRRIGRDLEQGLEGLARRLQPPEAPAPPGG